MTWDQPPDRDAQLMWLRDAVDTAPVLALTDRQMMAALRTVFDGPQRRELLNELERRLTRWTTRRHGSVAEALARLHETHAAPSRASQRLDQMLVRFLHQVHGEDARRLARSCLRSGRLLRRRAAWTYLRRHGLDPESEAVFADTQPEKDRDYIRFVTVDPAAVRVVGLERVLELLDAFYWRARAIESALTSAPAAVRRVAHEQPAETLVALRNAGARGYVDLARELWRDHSDDIDVLTSAVRCFAALHATDDLEAAVAQARQLLAREQRWW
jgi:hypothetical protein